MTVVMAWRNLWRQPRRTLAILAAVVVGVWAMVFFAALMRGVIADMLEANIANLTGHLQVQAPGFFENPVIDNRLRGGSGLVDRVRAVVPEAARVAARFRVSAVVRSAHGAFGATLVGIVPAEERGVSFIGDAVIAGEGLSADENGVLMGRALLERLETRIGHRIVVDMQGADGGIVSRAFRIVGVFDAQLEATEKQFLFCRRGTLQDALGVGDDLTEIAVDLPEGIEADTVAAAVREAVAGEAAVVLTWREMVPFVGAWLEGMQVFAVIWNFVVFVAMSFGIVNTVLMAVYERIREFGLVRALGVTPGGIVRLVVVETLMLLALGFVVGTLLSWGSLAPLARHGMDFSMFAEGSEYFGMSRVIFPKLAPGDFLRAGAVVFGLGLLVSLYPAVKAARVTPVQAMAHH
ncbi:MAG: ABC transporter permease [Verrucomicrobia bacterium]|nr:MAG: ABC transporter permease [Verrucomicrobiota bacterium]